MLQAECRRLEESAAREKSQRAVLDLRTGELKTEVANLKLKCARLERELQEFRTATPRLQVG